MEEGGIMVAWCPTCNEVKHTVFKGDPDIIKENIPCWKCEGKLEVDYSDRLSKSVKGVPIN